MIALRGHTGSIRSVAYHPDGTLLASGCEDGSVRLWSLVEQREVHHWEKLGDGVEAVTFAANGEVLVAGLASGEVLAWNLSSRYLQWGTNTSESGVRVLAAQGQTLVCANWDGELHVWDNASVFRDRVLSPNGSHRIYALAFHPREPTFAVALGEPSRLAFATLHQFNTNGPKCDVGPIMALAYSPDAQSLAVAGATGLQRLTPKGDLIHSFVGHRGTVYGVGFTPDGQRLISTGADATTRVWDVATGRELHVYQWHQRWATCLAVAPDGLTVATAGADGVVAVWDMPE